MTRIRRTVPSSSSSPSAIVFHISYCRVRANDARAVCENDYFSRFAYTRDVITSRGAYVLYVYHAAGALVRHIVLLFYAAATR